jgi:hypothetical protein
MEVSGALVPYKENDRASEIIFKMGQGVPYESSINFGGDGIKVEEVPDGESVEVNGAQFSGPGIVIREWPLRGVAVCPYGADMNTNSNTFSTSSINNNDEIECVLTNPLLCGASATSNSIIMNLTNTCTGAISQQWNNAANWSCNTVPSGNINIIIPPTTNQPIY